MVNYKIYYGLGGGFGGAKYGSTEDFDSQDEAMDYAYERAVEEYEKCAGLYGLRTYKEVIEELKNLDEELDEDDVEQAYNQEMERWLSYKVEKI
ncbi:hypothetical protein SAMN04487895_101572 [Paenibacillus sophorae]|uniref:Uncharacterized protein n=1 Tax=Paenibacillus sophorae TaxID=1333845 RepID=A0A1H8GME6_9BACL|nr:hypothetical protein [Paenibacillus sophorae]QWU14275.1 hypothetical protein KP014_20425 [Paenibacillus sophorae]SEN45143.1 hypothetical protein SAMN04487895_101572 [Paenibacillus sophorae]